MELPTDADIQERQQSELDRDQALANLDESIASREQAISDGEQARIDRLQQILDEELAGTNEGDFGALVAAEHDQGELTRAQERRDARQVQLDDAQTGRDALQDFFDTQQVEIMTHVHPSPADAERAAEERLESSLARADAAVLRAKTARLRLQAARLRSEPPSD